MSGHSDWLDLASEIMRPTNPESMAEKMERHKLLREYQFQAATINFLKGLIKVPEGERIGIKDATVDTDGKVIIIQYEMIPLSMHDEEEQENSR